MQPAQSSAAGEGKVVLHEAGLEAELGVALFVPGFHEKSAGITEHGGFNDEQTFEVAMRDFHELTSGGAACSHAAALPAFGGMGTCRPTDRLIGASVMIGQAGAPR